MDPKHKKTNGVTARGQTHIKGQNYRQYFDHGYYNLRQNRLPQWKTYQCKDVHPKHETLPNLPESIER